MRLISFIAFLVWILFSGTCFGVEPPKETRREVTLWMMAIEPPAQDATSPGMSVEEQIFLFNREFGKDNAVTVLNTTAFPLSDQLSVWNSDFGMSLWPIVKGQKRTLNVLKRFAETHNVHVSVRFMSWGEAFRETVTAIRARGNGTLTDKMAPDIVQIGSTWVDFFAKNSLLRPPRPATQTNLAWRSSSGFKRASLRYITDVRLMYYWKRLPSWGSSARPLSLDAKSWETIIDSIKRWIKKNGTEAIPPMVMPVGMTLNLLHDYIPLIWAGGGEFWQGRRVDLTSVECLSAPILLARNATYTSNGNTSHRLIAFPEMGHSAVADMFMQGEYLAIIEPPEFFRRWQRNFSKKWPKKIFFDYAAVSVPPVAFRGGSDFIVAKGTKVPDLAFEFARFLVTDGKLEELLVSSGHIPAQVQGGELERLLADNWPGPERGSSFEMYVAAINAALNEKDGKGRELTHSAHFAEHIETTPVLEHFQRLWRAMGRLADDGTGIGSIEKAAEKAEKAINVRIYWWEGVKEALRKWWWAILAAIMVPLLAYGGYNYRHWKSISGHLRGMQAFAATGLTVLGIHHYDPFRAAGNRTAGRGGFPEPSKKKRDTIREALLAWSKAQKTDIRRKMCLLDVVQRAFVAAATLRSLSNSSPFHMARKWDKEKKKDPNLKIVDFLKKVDIKYRHKIVVSQKVDVATPFVLEQALICLIENALKTARSDDPEDTGPLIIIRYNASTKEVMVMNKGKPPKGQLTNIINKSKLNDFYEKIMVILEDEDTDDDNLPIGIGLVEASLIARSIFGGLKVDFEDGYTIFCLSLAKGIRR